MSSEYSEILTDN